MKCYLRTKKSILVIRGPKPKQTKEWMNYLLIKQIVKLIIGIVAVSILTEILKHCGRIDKKDPQLL